MNNRDILHCDMNCFYASVECMRNPALKAHPVAVCGSVEERHGIVLAKNDKAKAKGVKTGEAVWQAKNKCPGLVVIEPHYEEYMKYSRKAHKIYERYTDRIEGMGIDECWLDVTGSHLLGTPVEIANEIREAVKFELGLTISVGVSFNKVFAKLGSDLKKPDAVTVIPRDSFREMLRDLPASSLLGVGRQTGKALARYGIQTVGQLADYPEQTLISHFGINGSRIRQFARGEDVSAVVDQNYVFPAKSVGNGMTFLQDLECEEEAWQMILWLSQEIGHKLCMLGRRARGIAVSVRDCDLHTVIRQCTLTVPTQSAAEIARAAFATFRRNYFWSKPIRTITVCAVNLCAEDCILQTDLFTDATRAEKADRLSKTVFQLRNRYGMDSVRAASILHLAKVPPAHVEIVMPHSGF